ncbi:hypothetical protein PN836_019780 [Ningiella sp. W23]|uniref:hypothetical protein n=1 Tax=Ningiella sp. W23 TaxID=3023715 RepID=UPI00375720F6
MNLKHGVSITLIANIAMALSQWAVIAWLNRSGNVDDVGRYAYSLALAGLALSLGHVGLRQYLMSDRMSKADEQFVFPTRVITSFLALFILAIISTFTIDIALITLVLILGLAKYFENLSDIAHGFALRSFKNTDLAISRIIRSILTPTLFILAYTLTGNISIAALAIVLAWVIVFLLVDTKLIPSLPRKQIPSSGNKASKLETDLGHYLKNGFHIVKQSYPMGISSVLLVFTVSFPLFMLGEYANDTSLGIYSSVFYYVTAASLLLQSLLQVLSPLFLRYFQQSSFRNLKKLSARSYAFALAYGVIGIMIAYFFGESVTVLLYGNAFIDTHSLVIAAATLNMALAIQSVGGIILTAKGLFAWQLKIMSFSALLCIAISVLFIGHRPLIVEHTDMQFPLTIAAMLACAVVAFFTAICFSIKVFREIGNGLTTRHSHS